MPETEAVLRAKQYRVRAEELRTIAASWIDRETRRILGRVASDYDHMAAQLEKNCLTEPRGPLSHA